MTAPSQIPPKPPHVAKLFVIHPPIPVKDYALQASQQFHWFLDERAGGFVLRGVRWAVAMQDMATVVVAVLDPSDAELDWLRRYTTELDADQYFKQGRPVPMGHNGLP